MEAGQTKPSTSSSSFRTSSFSVEALISKPDQKSPASDTTTHAHQSNFSMDMILSRPSSNEEDLETKAEPSSQDRRDSKESELTSTDFPWLHSTRYDPPPRKFRHCIYRPCLAYLRFLVITPIVSPF